ncbi:MAG: HPr family phosphocarrier protein [Deltaproteobacteria bacterium]|jgi:phosphotransferase system HPr-like phosphotransfer protein|nr:HPr family phosphocarrier protein [Deltaproteobacteria bacterium]
MKKTTRVIKAKMVLHLRPCGKIVKAFEKEAFNYGIKSAKIIYNGKSADMNSVLDLLLLCVTPEGEKEEELIIELEHEIDSIPDVFFSEIESILSSIE